MSSKRKLSTDSSQSEEVNLNKKRALNVIDPNTFYNESVDDAIEAKVCSHTEVVDRPIYLIEDYAISRTDRPFIETNSPEYLNSDDMVRELIVVSPACSFTGEQEDDNNAMTNDLGAELDDDEIQFEPYPKLNDEKLVHIQQTINVCKTSIEHLNQRMQFGRSNIEAFKDQTTKEIGLFNKDELSVKDKVAENMDSIITKAVEENPEFFDEEELNIIDRFKHLRRPSKVLFCLMLFKKVRLFKRLKKSRSYF